MSLLITKLALRAYRLEQGKQAESLQALVPDYLQQVPLDPYSESGRAMNYRLVEQESLLYSIGPNQVDDGGQRVKRRELHQGQGDFFLYNKDDLPPAKAASENVTEDDKTPSP